MGILPPRRSALASALQNAALARLIADQLRTPTPPEPPAAQKDPTWICPTSPTAN